MVLIYLISGIMTLAGSYIGMQRWFRFEKLNRSVLLNGCLLILGLFTLLMLAREIGFFPQSVAAPLMMGIYSLLAGFFIGLAWRLMRLRKNSGNILYMYRSFWVDLAPQLASILILLFGLYRTSILIEQPITGIRLTSGCSLFAFGLLGFTLRFVPEFRTRGILFLDRLTPWKHLLSWSWKSEEVISIEYLYTSQKQGHMIREFLTTVPAEDRRQVETILSSRMEEFSDEREKSLKEIINDE